MKFSCSRDELQFALNITRHGVKAKTTMSILSGILFNVYDHKLHLTATDLNIGITTNINVDAQEDGAIVLDANLIFSIISRLSGDIVYFESKENDYIEVKSDFSEFSIAGIQPDEFPEFPKPDTDLNFTISSQELRNLINKTRFAAAEKENQIPVITGIKMEYEKNNLKLVAIDGFRVALKSGNLDEETTEIENSIVSAKSLGELSNLLSLLTGSVKINLSKSQIFFQIDNTIFTARLIEGNFFDYSTIIPKENTTRFETDRIKLLNSCERAILISSEQKNTLIRFDIDSGKLKISSKNETGNFNDSIDIENVGNDLSIAFNTEYLIDALKAIDDDRVNLSFNGDVGPLSITPLEGDEYNYLILPVRINE